MTKDLKNKLNTFIILLFACVLLLSVSLFSDYESAPSKQMDNDANKIEQMGALNSKQAIIRTKMDTIESKLRKFEPTANDAVQLSTEIEKSITDLKEFFVKNGLGQNAFKGITDNYSIMLKDKQNIKNTADNIKSTQKNIEECKTHLAATKQDLRDLKNFQGKTNSNEE